MFSYLSLITCINNFNLNPTSLCAKFNDFDTLSVRWTKTTNAD